MNFFNQENKVRGLILRVLENPLAQMKEQEQTLKFLRDSSLTNIRRLQELEFIVSKFQRTISSLDETQQKQAKAED